MAVDQILADLKSARRGLKKTKILLTILGVFITFIVAVVISVI